MQWKFLVNLKSVNRKAEVPLGFLHAVYSGPLPQALVEPGKIFPDTQQLNTKFKRKVTTIFWLNVTTNHSLFWYKVNMLHLNHQVFKFICEFSNLTFLSHFRWWPLTTVTMINYDLLSADLCMGFHVHYLL